ncbi:MAG TPA: serine/threonine protein kinase, partial [Myxococcales bacterium]|nr:serine/threonine protein kinase [Myxococcales bacterium]
MVEEARQGTAAPPERVGAWKVGRQLGRGGAGAVFAATHEKTGVEGAIKIAHPSSGAVQRHWFLREAALATRLRHPAIVSLWEAGQLDDGRPFLVYERVVGPTLEEVAESLSLEQVVRFGAQLLDALGYAHDAGVVH